VRKSRYRAGVALLLLASVLAAGGTAGGAAPAATDPHVRELQDAIGEASANETAALRELDDVRARRQELDAKVAGYDRKIAAIEGRIAGLQRDVERLEARAAVLDQQAAQARAQLDVVKKRAAAAAAAMYRSEDGLAMYADVLEVDTFTDASIGTKYLSHISELRRKQVAALAGLQAKIAKLQDAASQQRDQVRAAEAQAQSERNDIAKLRREQDAQRDAVAKQEAHERSVVASIQSRKAEFDSELQALQVVSGTIRQILVAHQSGEKRASTFHARRPVPGAITDPFGLRFHPVLHEWRMHTGVDFHAPYGQTIRAAASGYVVRAGPQGGYGNAVVIDHGGQFGTVYAHASRLLVSTGEHVVAGQPIARVGSTGLATGPHLHFEVRILGEPVNPQSYL